MDHDRALIGADHADLVELPARSGPMNIVILSSRSSTRIGLLKAWRMVSSLAPCFRALSTILGCFTSYLAMPRTAR
jgi:hypothetical protein